jgi:hypothetical protein
MNVTSARSLWTNIWSTTALFTPILMNYTLIFHRATINLAKILLQMP